MTLGQVCTAQPLPPDDSPEHLREHSHPEKLGIVTPALRTAQHLPRKRRGAGVSLADVGVNRVSLWSRILVFVYSALPVPE
jgi:hypothetical protein